MKRLILALILLAALPQTIQAAGYHVGAFDQHVAEHHVRQCGQPVSGVTWTPLHAVQHFRSATGQPCVIVARYSVGGAWTPTPSPRPSATATKLPTQTPTVLVPTMVPTPLPTPLPSNDPVQQLLGLLNQDRAVYGSPPLTLISDSTTQQHAADMAIDGTIWHQSPNHPGTSFPYDGFGGENVGAGQSVQQLDTLMMGELGSPPNPGMCATTISHACNIINPAFRSVAVGIAYGPPYGLYLVEDFRD